MFLRVLMLFGVFSLVAQEGCTGLNWGSLTLVILQTLIASTVQVLAQILSASGALG
jgi:hypothetical protein